MSSSVSGALEHDVKLATVTGGGATLLLGELMLEWWACEGVVLAVMMFCLVHRNDEARFANHVDGNPREEGVTHLPPLVCS